jgi:hypothetical protein
VTAVAIEMKNIPAATRRAAVMVDPFGRYELG